MLSGYYGRRSGGPISISNDTLGAQGRLLIYEDVLFFVNRRWIGTPYRHPIVGLTQSR